MKTFIFVRNGGHDSCSENEAPKADHFDRRRGPSGHDSSLRETDNGDDKQQVTHGAFSGNHFSFLRKSILIKEFD